MNIYAGTVNNARTVSDARTGNNARTANSARTGSNARTANSIITGSNALKGNDGCTDTSGFIFTDIIEDAEIRSAREQTTGELYYSMVDIIFALREDYSHSDSSNYWSVMKHRLLNKRCSSDRINCCKVKVEAKDGKRRGTDFMNVDDAFFVLRKLSFCNDKEYLEEFLKKCANSKRTEDYY